MKKIEEVSIDKDNTTMKKVVNMSTDGTPVQIISIMQNTAYSREIIDEVRKSVDPNKLSSLKENKEAFRNEGVSQIKTLWHGIHGLNVHTEMFTVLFLIAMGVILIEIKNTFKKPHDFAKWRKSQFDPRHRRWFQQAVQLAEMGDFSRKYAALGKKRILQLESIRKREDFKSCEDILTQCPPDEDITVSTLPNEVVKRMEVEPFPDISYDLSDDLVKHYVDSVITFHRLKDQGISFADFDDAKLIAKYHGQAIPVQEAVQLKELLEENEEEKRPDLFENYVMDREKFPSKTGTKGYQFTLDKLVGDFLRYCRENQVEEDEEWLEEQKDSLDTKALTEAIKYLQMIAEKVGVNLETNSDNNKEGEKI